MKTKLVPKYQKGNRMSGYTLPEFVVTPSGTTYIPQETPSKYDEESKSRELTYESIKKLNSELPEKIYRLITGLHPGAYVAGKIAEHALNPNKQNTDNVNPGLAAVPVALAYRNPTAINPYAALFGLVMGASTMLAKKFKTKPSITPPAELPVDTESTTAESTVTENTTSSQPTPEPENNKDKKKDDKKDKKKNNKKDIFNNAKKTAENTISKFTGYTTGAMKEAAKSPVVYIPTIGYGFHKFPDMAENVHEYVKNYIKRTEKAFSLAPADTIPFTKTEDIQW